MKHKFFELARKLAFKSNHHTHKLGCVIVRKNEIVSLGFNKLKTHPKSNHPFKSLHAELDAILSADREDIRGADLYIFRETKFGNPAMAKPCKYCEAAIKEVGINRVFYSCNNGFELLNLN
jgi:deoxycytidylate deaminase